MLLLAIRQSIRAAREHARQIVEDLLLPAIDLIRVELKGPIGVDAAIASA
jgi:hypothetical protein